MKRFIRACFAAGVIALSSASGTTPAPLPSQMFDGYWTGLGKVTLAGGGVEQLKCVVTYKSTSGTMRQSLRCANAGQTINASAELVIKDGVVSGSWEEKTYAAVGSISGRVVDHGLKLTISGSGFSATMDVAATQCEQAISIIPVGFSMTEITIGLKKC